MYAVVRRYPGGSALADALVQRREEVTALLKDVPGFKMYHALRAADGTIATITLCEDQAGTQETSRAHGIGTDGNSGQPFPALGSAGRRLAYALVPAEGDPEVERGAHHRPDGRRLASGDQAGNVRIWSMTTRRLERSIRAHQGAAAALAFSGDGRWLATAGRDGRVRLWDMNRPRPPRTFGGQSGEVRALSFAPDGQTLASAGADGTVRLWSTAFMARSGS